MNAGPGPRRLILWDVDGTLMSAGPAAGEAFADAVASVVGREPGFHGVHMSGKTDPQIAMEILAALAVADEEARRHLPRVLEAVERELVAAIDAVRKDGRVLPGVPQLLERFAARPGVIQTVLTGNTEANGRLKVEAFGLDGHLDLEVGAFGSDSADRRDLVPIALRKLEQARGFRVHARDAWVIGDTPLDLVCARAGGARCLLVATGRVPFDELAAAGADAALPDLSDVERVEEIVLNGVG
jgi:phosphoglycolate phosphatase